MIVLHVKNDKRTSAITYLWVFPVEVDKVLIYGCLKLKK